MPDPCALNFDHVALVQRSRLGAVIAELPAARWPEVEQALMIACGFRDA
jgi:mRNA interferase MazF